MCGEQASHWAKRIVNNAEQNRSLLSGPLQSHRLIQ